MSNPSSNGASANGASADQPRLRLGGMALRNGLLIHGPTSWAAAARAPSGGIEVASGPKPDFGGNSLGTVPLLRGPIRLAEAFAVIPIARRALPSARLPFEDPRVLGAALTTMLLSAGLRGGTGRGKAVKEAASAALSLAPALVALSGSELAAYHGVEHKSIAAYEQGSDDAAAAPKEHERCGSNLVAPLLLTSLAGQLLLERLLERPGRLARATAAVGALSLSVEVFAFAERNPASALGRAVHSGGHTIQRLVATREPTTEQLEVGAAALEAALAAERAEAAH